MEVKVDATGRGEKKWLRLRWTYYGQRVSLSLGIPDTANNRRHAEKIALTIGLDFAAGRYDHANHKREYGLKRIGNKARVISCPEMFDRFLREDVVGLSRNGLEKYAVVGSWLRRLADIDCDRVDLTFAKNLVARMQETLSGNTVKAYLWILRRCWDWAVKDYDVASPNPWAVILTKVRGSRIKETRAFTLCEIQLILKTLYEHPKYFVYGDFVKFLVSTAARPGEVSPLVWADLSPGFLSVRINKSYSKGRLRNTTKNNRPRIVELPETIVTMLGDRYRNQKPKPTDLIFPAPQGGRIDAHNFCSRAWRKTLELAGLEYNKLYALRHTGISHALANGGNLIEVAAQAGNSPKVMSDTYSHAIERRSVFPGF